MKNSIIVLVLLLTFTSVLYLGFLITKHPEASPPPKNSGLPKLYVEGAHIKRSDTGEKVVLKGVSTMGFAYYRADNELMDILTVADQWGINLIELYIDPKVVERNMARFDYLIDWADKHDIYVYINPVDKDNNFIDQIDLFPKYLGQLAKRYKSRNHVFFGFGAEPNSSWDDWKKYSDLAAAEIIKNNPEVLIVQTGVYFGREVNYADVLPYKNVVYDYHEYPARNSGDLKKILEKEDSKFTWEPYQKKYPIIVGEFGGTWEQDFGSDNDLTFIQKTIDHVNKNGMSYVAYTADSEEGLGLIDWQTLKPTRKGEVIKKDLSSHPPTDFSLDK